MNVTNSIEILENLSLNINPFTGKKLLTASIIHKRKISQKLIEIINLLKEQNTQLNNKKTRAENSNMYYGEPKNAGLKWSKAERLQLIFEYKRNDSLCWIAQKHKRSEGAIKSEILKQGLPYELF